ncbi:MAG: gamma-glutamyl-gamma-aminobutyrate hydrolase family protein [Myxococcota bacterium]
MSSPLSVLLIDNFDSFSFNLVDEFEKRGANVLVHRNSLSAEHARAILAALAAPRLVVLSPGPGTPAAAGCTVPLVRIAAGISVPVFGVCLGHQAIVEAFGGRVGYAGEVVHGKAAAITHDGAGPLRALPNPTYAARYHSLAALALPAQLRPTARTEGANGQDVVMAVQHTTLPVFGVQFHPESILTPHGGPLLEAVAHWAREIDQAHPAPSARPAFFDEPTIDSGSR